MTATASATFEAIGVTNVVVVDPADVLPAALDIARGEVDALDVACSRFRHDSELSAVNRAAGAEVAVGPLLLEIVEAALRVALATDGVVDPSVGPSLTALGYDRDFRAVVSTGRKSFRLVPATGWQRVRVDRSRGTLQVAPGAALDLGAVAKAFAADRIAARIQAQTGASVLVGLGGDLAVAGAPAGGWPVRLADDHRSFDADGPTVAIDGGGLATSSTTVRRWQADRTELHHIVDPATGAPAVPHWRTVTVDRQRRLCAGMARAARPRGAARARGRRSRRDLPLAGGDAVTADWYLLRASGVVTLLLLTIVVALGVATTNRFRPRGLPRFVTTTVHRNASLLSVVFLAVHVVTTIVDRDANVQLAAVVVPFVSHWAPFWVGLGALALDLVAALVVTSLVRKRLPYRLWRGIHATAYAAWPLALAHGIGAGTDAGTEWLRAVNALCVLGVGAALAWRVLELEEPAQPREQRQERIAA